MNAPGPGVRRRVVRTACGPVVLTDDEELVSCEPCPVLLPVVPETPEAVLCRMAGVDRVEDVGTAGPLIAALANRENAANPELRRYEALFGRDALYSARSLAGDHPALEVSTVLALAALQAERPCPASQAERGKVPNHVRDPGDPLAVALTRRRGRRWPWFGGTDTTVLFLDAAARVLTREPALAGAPLRDREGRAVLWSGRPRVLRDAVAEASAWLLRSLAAGPVAHLLWVGLNDADSFTTWTDSPNAFSHPDGTLVAPPVAPIGLQALVHRSLLRLADAGDLGAGPGPALLRSSAADVRRQVRSRFTGPGGRVASALDGRGARPVLSTTVDLGTTLGSGLWSGPGGERARDAVVAAVLGPRMLTPFGIAGRARDDVRWTPFDYHSQVWAFASCEVAAGLRADGFTAEADDLETRVLRQTRDGLLPENVGSGPGEALAYCEHLLTVRRPAPDGSTTTSVKERPPAPHAAWTAAAVVAIRGRRNRAAPPPVPTPGHRPG